MDYIDEIHGNINIPEHIHSIIQTPHFQRLKKIQQLGLTYKTLPQANGNRYDHSIGTYYLAEKTLDALEMNTESLTIPDFYRKVVTIAALLHDIGHGPFSHAWEFICCGQYHHEENASAFIDEIFKVCLIDWDVERSYAIDLIQALIVGDRRCLRDQEYRFLFDILNNKNCGVDVDKWNYLQRDYFHAKDISIPEVNMDFEDVFLKARVSGDRSRIEYRYCDAHKIYNIFEARSLFHIHIYRKPITVCLEKILKLVIFKCGNGLDRSGLKLIDIQSKQVDSFFLFNDDEIWRTLGRLKDLGEIIKLISCLENPKTLSEIHPQSEEEKNKIADHLKAEIRIDHAGETFKSEKMIFYGNEAEKPTFLIKKGFHQKISYYEIQSL